VIQRTISADTATRFLIRNRVQRVAQTPPEEVALQAPVAMTSVMPEDYVLRDGFPYFPKYLVRSEAFLNSEGLYIEDDTYPTDNIFREEPRVRFISTANLWDDTALSWSPFTSHGVNYYFTFPSGGEPRIEEIDYVLGKRYYQFESVRIDEGTCLTSSFNDNIDDATSFMVGMAGIILTPDDASLIRVGTTPSNTIEVKTGEGFRLTNEINSIDLATTLHPMSMVPFYLVLASDPDSTALYVSNGVTRIYRTNLNSKATSRPLVLNIGNDLAGTKNLSMNLFELTIFPYYKGGNYSPELIINEMADVYGSAS